MLQHVCDCGRIAEVRRRSNGQRLAYSHCTHCKGSNTSIEKSKHILAKARDDIGVKGEFFEQTPETVTPSQTSTSRDFKPELEDLPETLESESNEESDSNSSSVGTFFKVAFGLLVTGGLGLAGYKAMNIKKG